jgi:uncharacterized protein (UPF0332 family)
MKPVTRDLFDKARRLLVEADLMLEVELYEAAGWNAYLAGCCAARALIFEDTNKVPDWHQGLWDDLADALYERGLNDPVLSAFLPAAYSLKRVADDPRGSPEIRKVRAEKAVADAKSYVSHIQNVAELPHPSKQSDRW